MTDHRGEVRFVYAVLMALVTLPLVGQESQQSFLCIADLATGFFFDETSKEWVTAEFNVTGSRYVVRPAREDDSERDLIARGHAYGVWRAGDRNAFASCEKTATPYNDLTCRYGWGTFIMNVHTLRFESFVPGSYLGSIQERYMDAEGNLRADLTEDKGGDTPVIEIGECSVL